VLFLSRLKGAISGYDRGKKCMLQCTAALRLQKNRRDREFRALRSLRVDCPAFPGREATHEMARKTEER
jgi:hypothetical protein